MKNQDSTLEVHIVCLDIITTQKSRIPVLIGLILFLLSQCCASTFSQLMGFSDTIQLA